MNHLRAVPVAPRRALGLIRVSKERHGMVSPEVQRVAIEDYCGRAGYDVVSWIEGIDESGSRARSAWWSRLEQAVSSVEAGDYDVVVVWKFSRTARNRLKWAVAIDRVEAAGGAIESATEQIDTTTSAGRFTRGMFAEMAAFEAERIGEGWTEAHQRRVRAGLPPTGKPKWGYAYDQVKHLHVPDPVTGPVLAAMYERYVAGESVYQLVRWLNAHGHRTLAGGLWSDHTLRRVLDSGFAAGKFRYRGQLHDGVHEPLIPPALWQAFLDARSRRRAQPSRRERSQYLFSGLVRCARCDRPMVAGQFGSGRTPKYRCKVGKEMGPEVCRGGYVMAPYLERVVVAWLHRVAAGHVDDAQTVAAASRAKRVAVRADAQRLDRQIGRVEQSIARLALQDAENPIPAASYRQALDELTEQHKRLTEERGAVGREDRRMPANPRAVARSLLDGWDTTTVHARRDLLGSLVEHVAVTTGRPRATFVIRSTWGEEWSPTSLDVVSR